MELHEALGKIKDASRKLVLVEDETLNAVLLRLADLLEERSEYVVAENAKDLAKMKVEDPLYDRVLLNKERLKGIADSVRTVAEYQSPIGRVLEERSLENGLDLSKVSVPLGVVGAIFEARPNVLVDTFVLCFKSKNACIMKGGSAAGHSNEALYELILQALSEEMSDHLDIVLLLGNDRELTKEFLKMDDYVDVIVPRGGQGLIDFVRREASIPVIETGRGVVHCYFDKYGDREKGAAIVTNAKLSRPSVCNALDTLLIHRERLGDLAEICKGVDDASVRVYADTDSFGALVHHYHEQFLFHAGEDAFGTEYLSLKMSVKVVDSLEEAVDHINHYGSGHSEAIITDDEEAGQKFLTAVDAATVYVNASTRFTDGGVFGLGAEVGISTQKLHARGPMGIKELTSYKWVVVGDGQVR